MSVSATDAFFVGVLVAPAPAPAPAPPPPSLPAPERRAGISLSKDTAAAGKSSEQDLAHCCALFPLSKEGGEKKKLVKRKTKKRAATEGEKKKKSTLSINLLLQPSRFSLPPPQPLDSSNRPGHAAAPLNAQHPQRVFETNSTTQERSSLLEAPSSSVEPSSHQGRLCRRIGVVFFSTLSPSPQANPGTPPLGSSEGSSSGVGSFLDGSRSSAGESVSTRGAF